MQLIQDDTIAIITIFQEAEGESYAGKLAVAEVIFRRTYMRYASDGTVVDTCLRPYQFSGWSSSAPNRVRSLRINFCDPVVLDCAKAWTEAKSGTSTANKALLYHATNIQPPDWAAPDKAICVATIGKHKFYVPR